MIIRLDFESETPIYMQLRHQMVMGIGKGELIAGESLPTVRQLAADIGINTMTVNKAYNLLKTEGFITIDRRHGAKVAERKQISPEEVEIIKQSLKEKMEIVIAEGCIKGMKQTQMLKLCETILEEMKVLDSE